MPEAQFGAARRLIQTTTRGRRMRGAAALLVALLASGVVWGSAGLGPSLGLWVWASALVGVALIGIGLWAVWPHAVARLDMPQCLTMAAVLSGGAVPVAQDVRIPPEQIRLALRAERDALRLVQGLAARVPLVPDRDSWASRAVVAAMAGLLARAGAAATLTLRGEHGAGWAEGVAVTAAHAHGLVGALARPVMGAACGALALWAVLVWAMGAMLPGAAWPVPLALATIWAAALFYEWGLTWLFALAALAHDRVAGTDVPAEAWQTRLATSSAAYRALAQA